MNRSTLRKINNWHKLSIIPVILVLGVSGSAAAQDLPAAVKSKLMLRVISFDHNLAGRVADGSVNIGILEHIGDSDSQNSSRDLQTGLAAFSKVKIAGMSFNVLPIPYSDGSEILQAITAKKLAVLYVTKGNDANLSNVCAATKESKILSLCGSPSYVKEGISIGFGLEGGKPKIYANLQGLAAEDASMPGNFLNMVKVLKK